MKLWSFVAIALAVLAWAGLNSAPAAELTPISWRVAGALEQPPSAALRGYGTVAAKFYTFQRDSDGAKTTLAVFQGSSPRQAVTVVAKYMADLTLSPGAKEGVVAAGGQKFRSLELAGGNVYVSAVLGARGFVLAGANGQIVKDFLTAIPAGQRAAMIADAKEYPAYLDRFDRYGWGFYGFGGIAEMDDIRQHTKAKGSIDPHDDLDFCAKHQFRFEFWMDTAQFDNCFGLRYWPEARWIADEAKKRGVPMSARLYGHFPIVWQFSDAFERPGDFLETGWYNGSQMFRTMAHESWFSPYTAKYLGRQTQDQMREMLKLGDVGSWMHPMGELPGCPWYALNADFSPAAQASWRAVLRDKRHWSLEEVSRMYLRGDRPFRAWSEVPVAEFATFAGLPGMIKDLAGNWYARWADKYEKRSREWWKIDPQAAGWDVVWKPGSESKYNNDSRRFDTRWFVRDFDLAGEQLAAGRPIYLYGFLRPTEINDLGRREQVYINGEFAGELGIWGAIDVGRFLKPGANRIGLATTAFQGRLFLSAEKPAVYPYLGEERNKLWMAFIDWRRDAQFEDSAVVMGLMRQVDPDRPIKIMAPESLGANRWLELGQRYGSWGHFTGEGMWFYPWYKRYGFLYGLPGTSEGGGPSDTVPNQEDLFQRIFLAGLNGHDQVFIVQHVTRIPALKQWYEEHVATLKQLGRYDIAGPQVLIFRSTDSSNYVQEKPWPEVAVEKGEVQSPWNWDIGRGVLQTLGQSYLYVDDCGIRDRKLEGYKILVDCGNETVNEKSLEGIGQWIREGGTYVVWPFSGKSTFSKPESWPIQELTGCKVKAVRRPGRGTVTIAADQPYLKELAGKTFPDNGSCKDCQKGEHNVSSVELEPGADCQVIARFENGSPAIVVRRLGAGCVVVLGSAFFRDSADIRGLWWPGEKEVAFFRDLLNGLGQPSVNTTSDPRVWPQRYRMNNGVDDVVVLVNFADGDRRISLRAATPAKPAKVYEVARNTIREVPFTMDGGNVVIRGIAIPRKEVQLYILRANDAGSAVQHWWAYQQRMWKPTDAAPIDVSIIEKGRWIDPVVDLMEDWRWTQDAGENWWKPEVNESAWKSYRFGPMNFAGAAPGKIVYLRKHFTLPKGWQTDGGINWMVMANWNRDLFVGSGGQGQLYLNGRLLEDWKQWHYRQWDVNELLREGDNVLALAARAEPKSQFLGPMGAVYVSHAEKPARRIDLAQRWSAKVDGKDVLLAMPGKLPAGVSIPAKKFFVPADWREKYFVTYFAIGDRGSVTGVTINHKVSRRHHHGFGEQIEVDLTKYLRFGEENVLEWTPAASEPHGPWDFKQVEMRLYRREPND